jgi:hypothetical protein
MIYDPDDYRNPWSDAVVCLAVWACAFLGLIAMGRDPPALMEPLTVAAPCGPQAPGTAKPPPRPDLRSTEEVHAS